MEIRIQAEAKNFSDLKISRKDVREIFRSAKEDALESYIERMFGNCEVISLRCLLEFSFHDFLRRKLAEARS